MPAVILTLFAFIFIISNAGCILLDANSRYVSQQSSQKQSSQKQSSEKQANQKVDQSASSIGANNLSIPQNRNETKILPQIPEKVPAGEPITSVQNVGEESAAQKDELADIPTTFFSSYDLSKYNFNNEVKQGEINALVVTKDGNRAFTGNSSGSVVSSSLIKPDLQNKQQQGGQYLVSRVLLSGTRPILALSLSPDERYLAVAQFSSVIVYDLTADEIAFRMTRLMGRVISLAWDPRGEFLALGRAAGDVFVWHILAGRSAGEDSLDAVEKYGIPGSPVVRIAFHPSGRAFFVAQQDGSVELWRLIRTELELGLRDQLAADDQLTVGKKNVNLGSVAGVVEDMWLDLSGDTLFVSSNDGNIYRWKIRGLKRLDEIYTGSDSVGSFQGLIFDASTRDLRGSSANLKLLSSTGRGQRLRFWCQGIEELNSSGGLSVPVILSDKVKDEDKSEQQTQIVNGRVEFAEETSNVGPDKNLKKKNLFLVAESEALVKPISILRAGVGSNLLWAAQAGAKLLIFDTTYLFTIKPVVSRQRQCRS